MRKARAEQLIFTRVEPAYSPQHKDGYQTIYKGKGLTLSEVEQIQKKIQCFQPKEPVGRQQFFMIDSGKVVLTYTIPIEGHPEIIDRNRRGAFIAHALIFDQNEFSKTNYNPFIIFDRIDLFFEDAETMVKEFGQATGIAQPVNVSIDEYDQLDPDWPRDEWLKLVALAEQAEELQHTRKSLFLLGSEDSIRETLEAVFLLTPPERRLQCSFDTHIDRCPTPPGIYWAVGGATRQSNSAFIQVLTQEKRIPSFAKSPASQKSLYTEWLEQASLRDDMTTLIDLAPTIHLLTRGFDTQKPPPLKQLGEAACDSFFEIHAEYIQPRLKKALTKAIEEQLVTALPDYFLEEMDTVDKLNIAISENFPLPELGTLVVNWLVDERPDLRKADWKKLQELAEKCGNMRLLHIAVTMGERDAKLCLHALQQMSEQEFQENLSLLFNPIAPADFVCKGYLKHLLSSNLDEITKDQFVDLVTKIMEVDEQESLTERSLIDSIGQLDDGALMEIENILKHYDAPKKFVKQVKERRQQIGSPGVATRVKSIANRVKKKII